MLRVASFQAEMALWIVFHYTYDLRADTWTVYVLANYGVLIYASLGLSGSTPLLLNACWTTFTLFGNTFTALTVRGPLVQCYLEIV